MAKFQKKGAAAAGAEKIDPTLPFVEIEIRDAKYRFCFSFRAIVKASQRLHAMGVSTNLSRSIFNIDFDNIVPLAAAGLSTYHPKLTFADVEALVDYETMAHIGEAVQKAFIQAYPKQEDGKADTDPPEAAAPASE